MTLQQAKAERSRRKVERDALLRLLAEPATDKQLTFIRVLLDKTKQGLRDQLKGYAKAILMSKEEATDMIVELLEETGQ